MYFEEPSIIAVVISAILVGILIAFSLVVAFYAALQSKNTHGRTGKEPFYGSRQDIGSQWLGGIEFNSVPKKQNWLLNTIKEVKEVSDYEKRRKESQFQRY